MTHHRISDLPPLDELRKLVETSKERAYNFDGDLYVTKDAHEAEQRLKQIAPALAAAYIELAVELKHKDIRLKDIREQLNNWKDVAMVRRRGVK